LIGLVIPGPILVAMIAKTVFCSASVPAVIVPLLVSGARVVSEEEELLIEKTGFKQATGNIERQNDRRLKNAKEWFRNMSIYPSIRGKPINMTFYTLYERKCRLSL
jgi:hypothetical protein